MKLYPNIEDVIPCGKERAISRNHLSALYGGGQSGDRIAREQIKKLRTTEVVINDQDGKGYYIPVDSDREAVELQFRRTRSRALSIMAQYHAMNKWLKEHSDQTRLEEN